MANIRKANISDANSCAEIVHSWVQATSWMPNRFTLAELESLIEEGMPNREIWVVGIQFLLIYHLTCPIIQLSHKIAKTPAKVMGDN